MWEGGGLVVIGFATTISGLSVWLFKFLSIHCNIYTYIYIYIYIYITVHNLVPKFTSGHNAIMVVTGRAHCSIPLYIYIYIYMYMYTS